MKISTYFRQARWATDPFKYVSSLVSRTPPYSYLQFSDIIKLGIKPNTGFDTPIGIYAYPLTPAIKQELFEAKLPFATDRKYAIFFKSRIDSNVLYSSRANNIGYKRLRAKLISRAFDKEWSFWIGDDLDSSEEELARLKFIKWWESQSHSKTDLGKLWNVTRMLANSKIMPWTSILLRLGVDGIVDDADFGIIHTNEPTQAIFFLRTSIKQLGTFPNVFSTAHLGKHNKMSVLLARGGGELINEEVDCGEMSIKRVRKAHLHNCGFYATGKVVVDSSNFSKCKIEEAHGSRFLKSTFTNCIWDFRNCDNIQLENCSFNKCEILYWPDNSAVAPKFIMKNVFMDDYSKYTFFNRVSAKNLNHFVVDGNLVSTKV